jgi:hypothetical protein
LPQNLNYSIRQGEKNNNPGAMHILVRNSIGVSECHPFFCVFFFVLEPHGFCNMHSRYSAMLDDRLILAGNLNDPSTIEISHAMNDLHNNSTTTRQAESAGERQEIKMEKKRSIYDHA